MSNINIYIYIYSRTSSKITILEPLVNFISFLCELLYFFTRLNNFCTFLGVRVLEKVGGGVRPPYFFISANTPELNFFIFGVL